MPRGDIRQIRASDIPPHDILCAGFPCQPFSKAGTQLGPDCPEYGDLGSHIIEWLRAARPRFFILENVPNFVRHRSGSVWRHFSTDLRQAGYDVRYSILSPHRFGVPQVRERLYVVGSRDGLSDFRWPQPSNANTDIRSVLDSSPANAKSLPPKTVAAIEAWARFIELYPRSQPKPYFPIWAAEFGATYPFGSAAPLSLGTRALRDYHGSFGTPLTALRGKALVAALPPYSRGSADRFPLWKIGFIQQNRDLYMRNRGWIDKWKESLSSFEHSFQKLEWHFDRAAHSLWDTVIQLRGSGIRAKSPTSAPALVAMTSTQVPVVAWERRYLTARECARLQGLQSLRELPSTETGVFRALGNAVNVRVTELVAKQLLRCQPMRARIPQRRLRA
jgi:DNA (cytosine-5)-methyltransferase 1